jgi:predicted permease
MIFTLARTFLFEELPVRDPDRLVQFFERYPNIRAQSYFENSFYDEVAQNSKTLAEVIAQSEFTLPLEEESVPKRVYAQAVTDNYFSTLGVRASLGRLLTARDDHVAVLSHNAWTHKFQSDRTVIGRGVRMGGQSYQIVGVGPAGFNGTYIDTSPDLWFPYRNAADFSDDSSRRSRELYVEIIGRLQPGVSIEEARQEADAVWARFSEGRQQKGVQFEIQPIQRGLSSVRTQFGTALIILWSGTGLLLLIVCSNVSSLSLARAIHHQKETAVRLALGSSKFRIVRQWFIESLGLSIAGAGLGSFLAYSALEVFLRWMPELPGLGQSVAEFRPLSIDIQLDLGSLGFATAICSAIACLFSLAPAWHCTRTSIHDALRGAIGSTRSRLQSFFCVTQIAFCTVLLLSAGLLVRTVFKLYALDPGFDRNNVVTFTIDPMIRRYSAEQTWSLQQRLLESARAIPGVESVGIAGMPLMRGIGLVTALEIPGITDDTRFNTSMNVVSPGYFEAMGIRILSGRNFEKKDTADLQTQPIIVNQTFAHTFFDGQEAIGRRVGRIVENQRPYEIIGIVTDAHYRSLREVPPPVFYRPLTPGSAGVTRFVLNVRTSMRPESTIPAVQSALRSIDPTLPAFEVATLAEQVNRSLWRERLTMVLAISLGSFAIVVSAMGLYGMLAFFVSQRRRELAIRSALGADASDMLRLLAGRLAPVVTGGLIAGAALCAATYRYIESVLYGLAVLDLPSITVTLLLVLTVSLAASAFPWIRAVRLNPAVTLRADP